MKQNLVGVGKVWNLLLNVSTLVGVGKVWKLLLNVSTQENSVWKLLLSN